ncbi:hypothetical protein COHA_001128 [Chlorella ohadii]|uniref:Uncharacterized protein n=1 Tax=Chlorella ohadii TaxID=2649997 RepID=A0AAD5H909_9CHLO|nr:hypothetical protein COHA_001128 [Chlorella ohadii]
MGSSASKVVRPPPPGRDPWAACQAGDLSTLSQWLDEGGQPDAVDSANGRGSLLHAAAAAEQAECVELLLKLGATVDLEVQSMGTPLHAAAACGATATILMLLHYGANPEARFRGRTPAELAQLSGSSATANLIRMHMVGNVPGPFDAHDDETLAPSGGGSLHSSMGSSRPWQIPFEDLMLENTIGEGSFGKVYKAKL